LTAEPPEAGQIGGGVSEHRQVTVEIDHLIILALKREMFIDGRGAVGKQR
jgi:hypothetical protein